MGNELDVSSIFPSHGSVSRRLSRIHPTLGVVTDVASWPLHGAFDQYWLALDRDGFVLLVASNSTTHAHAVARFQSTPYEPLAPLVVSTMSGSGDLPMPPIADPAGYAFAVRDVDDVPLLVRLSTLGLAPSSLTQLGTMF